MLWFDGYVTTYLERDQRALAAVADLGHFQRLMKPAALSIGNLLNQSELGCDVQLPEMTVHRYLNLLETSYQIARLAKRPIRTLSPNMFELNGFRRPIGLMRASATEAHTVELQDSPTRILWVRFGIPDAPTSQVRLEQPLDVLAQRFADPEHRPEFLAH